MYLSETLKTSDTRINRFFFIGIIILVNFVFGANSFASPEDSVKVVVKNPQAEALFNISDQFFAFKTNFSISRN